MLSKFSDDGTVQQMRVTIYATSRRRELSAIVVPRTHLPSGQHYQNIRPFHNKMNCTVSKLSGTVTEYHPDVNYYVGQVNGGYGRFKDT
jgi:hypothetical protein